MIGWLKRLLKRRVKPRQDARTYDLSAPQMWGDSMRWFDVAARRIVGWCDPLPRVGDVMRSPMRSGRVGLFVITHIDACNDPPDMFFGTVEGIGYEPEQGPYYGNPSLQGEPKA